MTLKDWAEKAIFVQDACNLIAVLNSYIDFLKWIKQEEPSKSSDYYYTHPISVLFANKIDSFTYSSDKFADAYGWAKKLIDGG